MIDLLIDRSIDNWTQIIGKERYYLYVREKSPLSGVNQIPIPVLHILYTSGYPHDYPQMTEIETESVAKVTKSLAGQYSVTKIRNRRLYLQRSSLNKVEARRNTVIGHTLSFMKESKQRRERATSTAKVTDSREQEDKSQQSRPHDPEILETFSSPKTIFKARRKIRCSKWAAILEKIVETSSFLSTSKKLFFP